MIEFIDRLTRFDMTISSTFSVTTTIQEPRKNRPATPRVDRKLMFREVCIMIRKNSMTVSSVSITLPRRRRLFRRVFRLCPPALALVAATWSLFCPVGLGLRLAFGRFWFGLVC